MKSGSLGRRLLVATAATAVLPLAVSGMPAQAQATAPASALAHHQGRDVPNGLHLVPACTLLAHQRKACPKADDGDYVICLYHSDDWCLGAHFDPAGIALAVIDEGSRSGYVVAVIEILGKVNATVAKVIDWLGDAGPYGNLLDKCYGAWQPDDPLAFGSCSSRHGIYWRQEDEGKFDFRWQNTYTGDDMLVPGPHLSENEWVRDRPAERGEWYTWAGYIPEDAR